MTNDSQGGLRGDPGVQTGHGDDTRDPHSSSKSLSLAARALVEQLKEFAQHKRGCDFLLSTNELLGQCTCGLSALLAQAGAHKQKEHEDLARMDIPKVITDDSRTAPTDEPMSNTQAVARLWVALKERVEGEHDDATHWPKGSERDGHAGPFETCSQEDCALVRIALPAAPAAHDSPAEDAVGKPDDATSGCAFAPKSSSSTLS